jgi:hypothetical protein
MIAECKCQQCKNSLEFEVSEFQETSRNEYQIFGQFVLCPNCQKETIIYLDYGMPEPPGGWPKQAPVQTDPQPNPLPPALEHSPEIVPVLVENTLDNIGDAFFAAGIIGMIICGIAALMAAVNEGTSLIIIFSICGGVISFAQGWVVKMLFRALAEMIRLLRKMAPPETRETKK